MKKILILLFTSMIMLSSCAISSSSERNVSNRPSWITDTTLSQTTIKYVITSNGIDENDAYKIACITFVDSFTNYLSINDKNDEYKESLINTLGVKDYDIYNNARYFEKSDKGVKGYFLFTANKESVNSRLIVKANNIANTTIEIQRIVAEAENYYKNNKDYKAFTLLIDAYILSRENNISERDISPDDLLERCVSILTKTRIEITNFVSDQLSCTIEVTRQVGLFPPNVLDSKLKISYSSFNSEMKTYLETERIELSVKQENYNFVPKNKTVYSDGVLLLEMDIDDSLYKLESLNYIKALKKLEIANKCYLLSYKKISKLSGKKIRLDVYENDLNQIPVSLIDVSNIVDVLESLGAIVTVDESSKEYSESSEFDKNFDYQITFKNEVTEKLDEFKSIVRTAGSVEVADLKTKLVVYSSDPYETIAVGENASNTLKSAFNSFALKGIFLLKENF